MKMAERGREKGNFCCVLNCLSRNDGHLLAQMFTGMVVVKSETGCFL